MSWIAMLFQLVGYDAIVPFLWDTNADIFINVSIAEEGLSEVNLLRGKSKHGSKDTAELH